MATTLMTTARLQAKSKEARDELLALFAAITEYSLEHEKDGVLRYITTVPWDDTGDENTVYMIEQYKDQAASDAHFNTPPVQALVQYLGTGKALAGPPDIVNWTPTGEFRKAEITRPPSAEVVIVYGTLDYPDNNNDDDKQSRISRAVKAYGELAAVVVQKEPQTYGGTFYADEEKGQIRVVELFESLEFLEGEHRKNEDVIAFKKIWTPDGMKLVRLKYVGGFLGR